MNIAVFEDAGFERLLPLTWLRATFELVCGKDRLVDKIATHMGSGIQRLYVREALQYVVPPRVKLDSVDRSAEWCLVNGRLLVTGDVAPPAVGTVWRTPDQVLAMSVRASDLEGISAAQLLNPEWLDELAGSFRAVEAPECVRLLNYPWEPALANAAELRRQLADPPTGGAPPALHGVHCVEPEQVRIAPRARIKPGVVLDAEDGPIAIEAGALIEPNAVIQGPCYIGPRAIVRPGAVIRSGTTIGPVCKVGGEVAATVFHGLANKQHDGYLGHSYVCPWVNLGADTVTSDLKNTYGTIRVSINGVGVETGQRSVGSIIGDHAKTGIGTILPTGCVLGVFSNVFVRGTVPRFVPSFAWLTEAGLEVCRTEKAIQIARIVMGRRDVELSEAEVQLYEYTSFAARTAEARGWEE